MTENSNEYSNTEDIFNGGEFVFTEKEGPDGTKEFIGGGYKINSFFLQSGNPIITTYNNDNRLDNDNQTGGKVSSPFENLAVPAGLFYVNMRIPKNNTNKDSEKHYNKHDMISDDIIDKLYELVEFDKKTKRKTKKHAVKINKTNKSKTRKARI